MDRAGAIILIVPILFGLIFGFVALVWVDHLHDNLIEAREIAETARINTVENGRNLAVVREQWNLKHNDRIEFTVRVGEGGE
jgi:hypothetical protein